MKKIYLTMGVLALASVGFSDTAIFNSMPSGTYFTGAAALDNVGGEYYAVVDGSNAPIVGFDENFVTTGTAGTSTNYSDLQLQVTFFTSGNATWSNSGNELSGPGVSQTYDFGNRTLGNGFFWDAASLFNGSSELTLTTPQAVSGNVIGVQYAWVNNVGGTVSAVSTIENAVLAGTAPAIGSNAQTQYSMVFGASGNSSSTPLLESQYLYTGATLNLSSELFASSTPEPASMAVLGLGLVGLIARRRRRASK